VLGLCACTEAPVFQGNDFTSDPLPPPALGGHIVAIDFAADTLAALTPAPAGDFTVEIGLDPVVPEGPRGLAVAADGTIYFVLSGTDAAGGGPHGPFGTGVQPARVARYSNGAVETSALVEPSATSVALSPDGATLYVGHDDVVKWQAGVAVGDLRQGDSDVAIVDTASMRVTRRLPVCPAIGGIALSADGKTLFAACGPDELGVVDLSRTPPAVTRVALPGGLPEGATCASCPSGIAVAPDGAVWIAESGGADVYDPATPSFGPRLALCGDEGTPAFTASGAAVFPETGCAGGDGVEISGGGRIAAPGCDGGQAVAIGPSGDAYLACATGGVFRIDLGAATIVGSSAAGDDPIAIGFVP
jgi:DNA-binding beta-propeller fold protein YncE